MKKIFTANSKNLIIIALMIILGVIYSPITYLTLLYMLLIVLFDNDDSRLIGMLIVMFPFAYIFKISFNSSSLFTYIQLLVEFKLIVKNTKINKSFLGVFLFYAMYVLIGLGDFKDVIKQIMIPVLIYFAFTKSNRKEMLKYTLYYVYSVIAVSFIGLLKNFIPNMSKMIVFKAEHLGSEQYLERFSGVWGDPNYYTINLILAFSIVMFFHMNKYISETKAVTLYLLLTSFGALTGSKSFLMMIIVGYIWLIIEAFKAHRYIFSGIILVAMILMSGLIISGKVDILDNVLLRLSRVDSIDDLTTGRFNLFQTYTAYFAAHPIKLILGNGMGKMFTFSVPHNTYIDFLDVFGIIGSILFVLSIYVCVKKYKVRKKIINFLPSAIIIIMYFFLSMLRYLDLPFHILLGLIILYGGDCHNGK